MGKSKIFFYQSGTSGGGSKRSLIEIIRTLQTSTKFELSILCTNRGWFTRELDKSRIGYQYFSGLEKLITVTQSSLKKQSIRSIATILISLPRLICLWIRIWGIRPDLMVINEGPREFLEFLPFLFLRKSKIILISQIETELSDPVARFICQRVDKIFAASDAVRNSFLVNGFAADKVQTVPLIIDIAEQPKNGKPTDIRAELGLNPSSLLLVNVANIHPRKGIKDLVAVLAELKNTFSGVHLLQVGSVASEDRTVFDYELSLKATIAKNHLQNNFHFLGFREDIPQWLNQADVAVFPTHREGLCRAAVECLWAGVPIVTYDLPSMRPIVTDTITGFVVSEGNVSSIVARIKMLLLDSELRSKCSKNSQRKWQDSFQPQRAKDIALDSFTKLLNGY